MAEHAEKGPRFRVFHRLRVFLVRKSDMTELANSLDTESGRLHTAARLFRKF